MKAPFRPYLKLRAGVSRLAPCLALLELPN
jgi:hypothetical protein